ncbi:GAF and ANTAR domain-containing protein [Actinoplanes sp. NPDC049265]|uniref:GAF and ANTAR domain-containing protein n=1 Tax=Actinoplanes sp. NPDC049265 TaxID=3363902 RepID=UPI003716A06C
MTHHPIDPLVAFAELSNIKLRDSSLDQVLARVARLAARTVPGADEVSITLITEKGPHTAAHTGDLALRLDERQYEAGDGPCLRAAAGQTVVEVPDTAADRRWGPWAPGTADSGFGSALSVGLPIMDDISGALNLYGRRREAFDADATTLAGTFAGYAAVALANAHQFYSAVALARHLQAAMDSRAVIEQAKGIVMAQRRCAADEAFAFLTKVSQDNNRKLRDVAAALVAGVSRTADD